VSCGQAFGRSCKTAEQIYHACSHMGTDPDVAVDNPYYVPLRFTICSTHIPDLGIRAKVCNPAIAAREIWVFLFDEYLGVE